MKQKLYLSLYSVLGILVYSFKACLEKSKYTVLYSARKKPGW